MNNHSEVEYLHRINKQFDYEINIQSIEDREDPCLCNKERETESKERSSLWNNYLESQLMDWVPRIEEKSDKKKNNKIFN